jgi:hypothetical protein
MTILIADLETDGLKPSIIWVVGILDYETDEFRAYVGDEVAEGLMRIAEADLVIGHNFTDYDARVIKKLTDSIITIDRDRIVDTLALGRKLLPHMKCQKLEEWGDILGLPKIIYTEGFSRYNPKMVPYCERDCRLNKRVFDFLIEVEVAQAASSAGP